MPLNTPQNALEIESQIKTDIKQELQDSNPFLPNSYFGAMATGQANRLYDFYVQLLLLQRSLFIDTAQGDDLDHVANQYVGPRNGASKAVGLVCFEGVDGSPIANATTFAAEDGQIYTSTEASAISVTASSILSITQVAGLATMTYESDHLLTNGVSVTVSGSDQSGYNGTHIVTVVDSDVVTFSVDPLTTTPSTGSVTSSSTFASIPVESNEFGQISNQVALATVSLQSPIVGVNNDGGVDFGAIGGGSDQETDEEYRARALDELQNPVPHFGVSDIERQAKKVEGVTRVFVREVTPSLGQVTVYFTRDNDANPIPDSSEVTAVKDELLKIKPANTSDADLIVQAPLAISTDFVFNQLMPNTSTMAIAVQNSLSQFFDEDVDVGVNVDEDLYRAAIANTVDTATGESVASFDLSEPVGDLLIVESGLPTLGTVTTP